MQGRRSLWRRAATKPARGPLVRNSSYWLPTIDCPRPLTRCHQDRPSNTRGSTKRSCALAPNGLACVSSVASLTLGPQLLLAGLPSVSDKSNTRIIELLVFLLSRTFAWNLAAEGSKCPRRNTRHPPDPSGVQPASLRFRAHPKWAVGRLASLGMQPTSPLPLRTALGRRSPRSVPSSVRRLMRRPRRRLRLGLPHDHLHSFRSRPGVKPLAPR